MMIKYLNRIFVHFLGYGLYFFKMDDTGYAALNILRKITFLESKAVSKPIPLEKQVFFVFANRMIIDAESARLLAHKGYYGAGYCITAIMLRNIAMYASLLADKARINDFWNEEKNTYQDDPSFVSSFKESAIRNLAKRKFGEDAFNSSELEKLLHGSCYAIRKYYSKKGINSEGKSEPVLTLGKFKERSKEAGIKSIAGAITLDFLGLFFTEYKESGQTNYDDWYTHYLKIIKLVQIETIRLEKQYEKISRKIQ